MLQSEYGEYLALPANWIIIGMVSHVKWWIQGVIAARQYGAFAEFLRIPNLNAARRTKASE